MLTEFCIWWGEPAGPRGSPWTRKNETAGSRADQGVRPGVRPTYLLLSLLLASSLLYARRLPIRTYTTADWPSAGESGYSAHPSGLPRLPLVCTARRAFALRSGYSFTNYQTADGLPGNVVRRLIETRAGIYWIATTDGVVRFDPRGAGAARFRAYPLSGVKAIPSVLREDREGGIWCGTSNSQGVFYLGPHDPAFHHVDMPGVDPIVTTLLIDRRGAMWMGTASGLFRRDPDGSIRGFAEALRKPDVMALLEDRAGRLWVGTRTGLVRMDDGATPTRVYGVKDGLPNPRVESLLETSEGKLWVGTADGLAWWTPSVPDEGREFQSFSSARRTERQSRGRDGGRWRRQSVDGHVRLRRHENGAQRIHYLHRG